jgi:hypothetical protein
VFGRPVATDNCFWHLLYLTDAHSKMETKLIIYFFLRDHAKTSEKREEMKTGEKKRWFYSLLQLVYPIQNAVFMSGECEMKTGYV